jgi:hypothetical protein
VRLLRPYPNHETSAVVHRTHVRAGLVAASALAATDPAAVATTALPLASPAIAVATPAVTTSTLAATLAIATSRVRRVPPVCLR